VLTKVAAQALILDRLKSRCSCAALSIAESRISDRPFGWVFEISVDGAPTDTLTALAVPTRVIVNKHSAQVVASSIEYDVEQFVRLYEKLLAQNQARIQEWCGTIRPPFPWNLWRKRTVAEHAKDGGFYEIGGKEGES